MMKSAGETSAGQASRQGFSRQYSHFSTSVRNWASVRNSRPFLMRVYRPWRPAGGARRRESGRETIEKNIACDKHKFQAG
jgi:hypothetical protein